MKGDMSLSGVLITLPVAGSISSPLLSENTQGEPSARVMIALAGEVTGRGGKASACLPGVGQM